jgi:hypothetical protein
MSGNETRAGGSVHGRFALTTFSMRSVRSRILGHIACV